MLNIVLFGPPGAGKGTQSEKLIQKYGLVHLSTGDIFRANIKGETTLGTLAKGYMDKGELVPDEVTIRMLEQEVNKNADAKGFIFDGFPRTSAQAEALDRFLAGKGWKIAAMIALEVDDEELKKRLLLRGKDSGRADDQDPNIIENRINVYNRDTAPLKTFYSGQGKYRGVYGIGSIDEIFEALCKEVDALGTPVVTQPTATAPVKQEKKEKPGLLAKIAAKLGIGKKREKKAAAKKETGAVIKRKAEKPVAKGKTTKPNPPKSKMKKKAAAPPKKKVTKPVAKKKTAPKKKVAKPVAKKKTVAKKKSPAKKKSAPKKKAAVRKPATKKSAVKKKSAAKKPATKRSAAKKKTSARNRKR